MNFGHEAAALAATLTDRMTLRRQRADAGGIETAIVFHDRPCALSRSAHTASPAPADPALPMGESRYRMSLFMPAGTQVCLGDQAEIRRGGQIFWGSCSDSLGYPSHSVCVVDIQGVEEAGQP